jgi:hypothetical protein
MMMPHCQAVAQANALRLLVSAPVQCRQHFRVSPCALPSMWRLARIHLCPPLPGLPFACV